MIDTLSNNGFDLSASFPGVFMYGCAYQHHKLLNTLEIHHLLLQYTTHATTSKDLIFLFYNQYTRDSNIYSFNIQIKGSPESFKQFYALAGSSAFKAKLKASLSNPDGKDAKQVLIKVLPLLKLGGKQQ
eukprot:1511505-Ditylum_brightwellii.AAC.1